MSSQPQIPHETQRPNNFSAADVLAILHQRRWLPDEFSSSDVDAWAARAASMLGPYCPDSGALAALLQLVFEYDAPAVLQRVESHSVLARNGAREVIRRLAFLLLEGPALDSARFKQIIDALKEGTDLRSRDLFHPIRLALAGKAGEGELDRVVLLLDEAASLPFAAPVKSARERIIEFCAALD
jgi:hypothetical protein